MARTKKKNDLVPPKTFGERVKAIRNSLKLTQKEMAPVVGISETYFSEIEKDKAKVFLTGCYTLPKRLF
jgi:DNA-binding XRE family transcriptional regulator